MKHKQTLSYLGTCTRYLVVEGTKVPKYLRSTFVHTFEGIISYCMSK